MVEDAFYAGLPRKRVASGALITDEIGRVLMVEPTYKDAWEIPGGAVEVGETAVDACRRECLEELGIELDVGALLVVEHQTDGERGDSIMFVYDGGTLVDPSLIALPPEELRSHRFLDAARLDDVTVVRLARRVRYALRARAEHRVIELADGVPTTDTERS